MRRIAAAVLFTLAAEADSAGQTRPNVVLILDSVSFLPVLRKPGTAIERRVPMVIQSGNGSLAIREGRWKLCLAPGSGGLSAPVPGSPDEQRLPPVQLFDLGADPAEKTNLQDKHPDIVQRLTALVDNYRKTGRSR